MYKFFLASFGLIILISLAACNASNATHEVQTSAKPTGAVVILPTSTTPYIQTIGAEKQTAIAEFSKTQATDTVTPTEIFVPSYEECSWGLPADVQNWVLCSSVSDPITFVRKSNQVWQFSYKNHYGREIPHPCTNLRYITSDENYLYFSLEADCPMTEPGFETSIGLFRMNLTNGDVSEILKTSYDFDSFEGRTYSLSISPTGRRLAYIDDQDRPLKLNILDLKTGEVSSFLPDEKYHNGGLYAWSEDGTKLVFMLDSESNYDYFVSMVFIDLLKEDSMVTFIKDKDYSWMASRVEVMDDGVKITPIDGEPLFYDLETGILSPASK